jgi:hypothetical protein
VPGAIFRPLLNPWVYVLVQVLESLIEGRDLAEAQTSEALQALVAGAEPAQMAAFLVLLRAKGETAEEVAGLAKAMRALSVPVHTGFDGEHPPPLLLLQPQLLVVAMLSLCTAHTST